MRFSMSFTAVTRRRYTCNTVNQNNQFNYRAANCGSYNCTDQSKRCGKIYSIDLVTKGPVGKGCQAYEVSICLNGQLCNKKKSQSQMQWPLNSLKKTYAAHRETFWYGQQ
jgi:hypothetical protein